MSEETLASSDNGSPFFLLPAAPSSAGSPDRLDASLFSVTARRGGIGEAATAGGGPSLPAALLDCALLPLFFHISALLGR